MIIKRIEKYGLCPRDLNRQVTLYTRTVALNSPNAVSPTIELVELGKFMCAVETVKPQDMQFGLNAGTGTTHIFVFQYSSRLVALETKNTYIKLGDSYYALEGSPLNLNEQNRVLIFECTKRGLTTEKESLA